MAPAQIARRDAKLRTEGSDPYGRCIELPAHLEHLPAADLYALLDFANEVQAWALRDRVGTPTFGEVAEHFGVPLERAADAVAAHYWMFTLDDDRPLAERRIEHEGE